MVAFAGEGSGGLAEVVLDGRVGAVGDEEFREVAAVGCGGGKQGGIAGSLAGVGVGAAGL